MSDETKHTHEDGRCLSCGGMVDADGYAMGGEVDEDGEAGTEMPAANDSNPAEDDANVRDFVAALRKGGKK